MTNYYIQENDIIVLFDTDKQRLEDTIKFMPQCKGLEIQETDDIIVPILNEEGETVSYEIITQEEYEHREAEKEAERIAHLNLTSADVERGLYKALGSDFEDIIERITLNPPLGLDVKALKIELKANNFYRGNPYIDAVGGLLGLSKKQLDKFFEFNDYTYLLPLDAENEAESVQ